MRYEQGTDILQSGGPRNDRNDWPVAVTVTYLIRQLKGPKYEKKTSVSNISINFMSFARGLTKIREKDITIYICGVFINLPP